MSVLGPREIVNGPQHPIERVPDDQPLRGKGVLAFGSMLANSFGFSQCLAKRVFQELCGKVLPAFPQTYQKISEDFENQNHNLKYLFARVASDAQCFQHPKENL